jgi:hypothetical protein
MQENKKMTKEIAMESTKELAKKRMFDKLQGIM